MESVLVWKKLQDEERNNPPRNQEETNSDEEEELHFHNYGFKSPRTPPGNKHLRAFEDDMFQLIVKV